MNISITEEKTLRNKIDSATIYYTDGNRFDFNYFEPRLDQLIKIKIQLRGVNIEDIYACVDKEQKIAVLKNPLSYFLPYNSWGLCLPVKFLSENLIISDLSWIDWDKETNHHFILNKSSSFLILNYI